MQVLVVGGEHAFVHGTFASKLNSVGVDIGAHWDWTLRRPPQVIPKGCKGVVVLHDMVGHHLSNAAKDAASTAGVPFALVPRKFSAALPVLQQAGIVSDTATVATDDVVEVTDAVAVVAETVPVVPDTNRSEVRSWIALVLESDFAATDRAVAEKATEFVNGVPRATLDAEVPRVREEMRKGWGSKGRSAEADRTLRAAADAWLARSKHDPDDPLSLPRIRAEARTLFGVSVPDDVLLNVGYQVWELRGLMTRERVRNGLRDGDSLIGRMTPAEFDAFRNWVIDVRDNGKACASKCPLTVSLKGLPTEGITVILRAVPDISASAAARVYQQMTGASLGPYYYAGVVWAAAQVPNPAAKFDVVATAFDDAKADPPPVVEAPAPTPVVEADPLLVRLTDALFGGKPVPEGTDIVAVAKDARTFLDALDELAEVLSVATEPSVAEPAFRTFTSKMMPLANRRVADIIARRDLEVVEEKRRQAETAMKAAEEAFLKAREEYRRAQGIADQTKTTIEKLRSRQ